MTRFIERHPLRALIILIVVAAALWLIFATWPQGLEDAFGRKKVFLSAVFNGITLGGLYFLVASGFTLIFGLMRNVNPRTARSICSAAISAMRSASRPDPGY
jgi:branched-chain amino acid transport system permease protein